MTEPGGPAWRQTTFHPFAQASRYGRGEVLDVEVDAPDVRDQQVTARCRCCTPRPCRGGRRGDRLRRQPRPARALPLEVALHGLECRGRRAQRARGRRPGGPQHPRRAGARRPARRARGPALSDGVLRATLEPLSWNVIRLELNPVTYGRRGRSLSVAAERLFACMSLCRAGSTERTTRIRTRGPGRVVRTGNWWAARSTGCWWTSPTGPPGSWRKGPPWRRRSARTGPAAAPGTARATPIPPNGTGRATPLIPPCRVARRSAPRAQRSEGHDELPSQAARLGSQSEPAAWAGPATCDMPCCGGSRPWIQWTNTPGAYGFHGAGWPYGQ